MTCSDEIFPQLGDCQGMTSFLDRILDDPSLGNEMGRRSRERAEEFFSAEENAWLLARIYQNEMALKASG